MGNPVEPLFSDRAAFADFFTRYYTDFEPENCLVATDGDLVVGYLIACLRFRRYPWMQLRIVLSAIPGMLARACAGRYRRQDFRFLGWFLARAGRETPRVPRRTAHFHLNILKPYRNGGFILPLMLALQKRLEDRGVRCVYAQIQTRQDRRTERLFERYGFRLFDRRRVSKFDRFGETGVFVSTFVREMDAFRGDARNALRPAAPRGPA